jgi:hypothetical protein
MAKNTSAPLYLTAKEQAVFAKLPQDVQGDWKVEIETLTFEDNDARRKARLSIMELKDSKLLAVQEKAKEAKTSEDLEKLIQATDLSGTSDEDLFELFFALGPDAVTTMIAGLMSEVKSTQDLESIGALAALRHALLHSMQSKA